ncbi:type II toxin-antitoxin system HipA family toxin [Okibacterium endophyticum]
MTIEAQATQVWLRDELVGMLTPTRRGATFQFSEAIAAEHRGEPLLSASLPVQSEPFDPERTRSWFMGLLPEEQQLDEVRRRFNLFGDTYLDVLREIGWECAGAVVIVPEGANPTKADVRPLNDADLAERLVALPARPYDDDAALRVSLGGFQAKMLTTRIAGGWGLPIGGAVSTHILKPQPTAVFPGIIEAEAWGMALASHVTETAHTELLPLEDAPATLVVERFDRKTIDGTLVRTHQEDGAQAMGIPPERKYAGSGTASRSDPTFQRIAALLDRYADNPRDELRRLVEQMTVNVAVGNTDAHAKNYGILHTDARTIGLSPMYDVVPATVVNPRMLEMSLRIDATLRIDRITGEKLIAEARSWGVGARPAERYVSETLARLRDAIPLVGERYPDAAPQLPDGTAARIERLLSTRRE